MKRIIKKIYQFIPFKKQIFQFIKYFGTPSHSVYKHLHFTGVITVKAGETGQFKIMHYGKEIENDIFWSGLTGWEEVSMRYWMELCKNSKVIFDIGANTGIYALTAKAINSSSCVYAFEPLKQMYDKLVSNVKLNSYDIHCVKKAVSHKNGKAIIYETGDDHVAAASLNVEVRQYGKLDQETEIETITLDSYIEENKIDKIDLLKIDVETHEPSVMEGYMHYFLQHRPDFLIEVLTDEVGEKLQQVFDGHNYFYFNIDDKHGAIRQETNIRKSDYFNYLLLTEATARKFKLI